MSNKFQQIDDFIFKTDAKIGICLRAKEEAEFTRKQMADLQVYIERAFKDLSQQISDLRMSLNESGKIL
jgi:hypothetical protein